MSFNLPTGEATKAVCYITEMQSTAFGRSAVDVRGYVSQSAEKSGRGGNPVNDLVVTKNPIKHCKCSQNDIHEYSYHL
jgi:hypothetical protein